MVAMAADGAAPRKHSLKLKGTLGAGAFGDIHKGVLDGEIVAVKTLSQRTAAANSKESEWNSEMFFREAQMLRSCSHKRIVGYRSLLKLPASESKSKEAVWALAMEYCKGGNLTQLVARQMTNPGSKQYSNVQAIGWALDVASALEYLHLRTPAVLHRDVKSANIMLTAEDNRLVAKLSDFGLHVTADSSKYTALQRYSMSVENSSSLPPKAPALQDHGTVADTKQLPVQQQQQVGCSPGTADIYGEVHDSAGSRVFVDSHSNSAKGALGVAQSLQQEQQYKQHPDSSRPGTGSFEKIMEEQQQQHQQSWLHPQRHNSFRRASHHPPGDALPRLPSGVGEALLGVPRGVSIDMEAAADANAQLFAHWGTERDSLPGGSMCSMVSEGTWATGTVSRTDTAGSDCTDDNTCGGNSVLKEQETVFDMTGNTGSCLYMAPEVHLKNNYNEKSDVFSFGVVLYELMARTLVAFTELPQHSSDPALPHRYAAKVAAGYRPSRPKSMPDNMWALITACWQQDPVLRPHMSEVVAVLSAAVADAAMQQLTSRRTNFSLVKKSHLAKQASLQPHTAAPTAAAASVNSPHESQPSAQAGGNSCNTASGGAAGVSCNISSMQKLAANNCDPSTPPAAQGCGCVIS